VLYCILCTHAPYCYSVLIHHAAYSVYSVHSAYSAYSVHHFRRALVINPRSSVLYCYLGMVLHANRKYDEALTMLAQVLHSLRSLCTHYALTMHSLCIDHASTGTALAVLYSLYALYCTYCTHCTVRTVLYALYSLHSLCTALTALTMH
jgi:hypothetical protein